MYIITVEIMNLNELFKCKNITPSTLQLYKSKLNILNDNKPINNLNFLSDTENITNKIKHLKPNTRRSYIIAITSVLKCLTLEPKPPKKIIELYNNYSKLLETYNTELKDQSNENTNVIPIETIETIYKHLNKNKNKSLQSYQDYLIVSLYYLIAPRRNKDYQLLKYVSNYDSKLSNDFNYYDGFKFYFNNYKTKGTYNQQVQDVPPELVKILDKYIELNDIVDGDYIITSIKTGQPLKTNNSITVMLNRIFKDKIGSSALRRSYLTNKYSNIQNELNNDVKNMGTSLDMATNNYIKKKN